MRLGKAVAKWVFSKHEHENSDEKEMRQDYNDASKALAMSILLNNVTVTGYKHTGYKLEDNNLDSTQLQWFTADNNDATKLDLTNGNKGNGLGGKVLTDSDNDLSTAKV